MNVYSRKDSVALFCLHALEGMNDCLYSFANQDEPNVMLLLFYMGSSKSISQSVDGLASNASRYPDGSSTRAGCRSSASKRR